jgi:hypothetical protein
MIICPSSSPSKLCGFGEADFLQWHHKESEWLASRVKEPVEDTLTVSYVEALEKLRCLKYVPFVLTFLVC